MKLYLTLEAADCDALLDAVRGVADISPSLLACKFKGDQFGIECDRYRWKVTNEPQEQSK